MFKKILFFVILFGFSISCNKKEKVESETLNLDFIQTFGGSIDENNPFHLKLNSDNGKISGVYFYDKIGIDIELKGTLTKDSILILNEYDNNGNQTGLWKGRLINQNKFKGVWSKPNESSAKEFTFIQTSENYENVKSEISNSTLSNVAQESEVSFAVIENVPIYPGCENEITNEAKKECMASKISAFVNKNFNTNLANDLGLEGRQRINVRFKIDEYGNITDITARARHPRLEEEAINTVKYLPRMIPGKQRGKPVGVLYSLPIIFDIQ